MGSVTKNIVLEKDCPEGSMMGPFVWNFIINDLVCNVSKFQICHKIVFADDFLLIVQGGNFKFFALCSKTFLTIFLIDRRNIN